MRHSTFVFRVFSACLLIAFTLPAPAAVLYQTVRTDCEYGANLSAVRNMKVGELSDVRANRVAVIGRNLVQRIMTAPLELWDLQFVTADATRAASIVVTDPAEAEGLVERLRAARVVEWIGPCYASFRIDGEEVHASEDPMIVSDRWVRVSN